jgi:hypothetical protein
MLWSCGMAVALPAAASLEDAVLLAVQSPAELRVSQHGKPVTLRFAEMTEKAGCGATGLRLSADQLAKAGTSLRLSREGERTRVYFSVQGETVEWSTLVLGAGLAGATATAEEDQRDAEAAARTARLGVWGDCREQDVFTRVARESNVDRKLLYSVALTESGRNGAPWPWTLNVEGESYYYESREKAHDALVKFLKRGKRSIDVGYMQVNLAYNGVRFPDTWVALDPYRNVVAASQILRENFKREGSVERAVGHYHSRTPWRAAQYFTKVSANHRYLGKESQ